VVDSVSHGMMCVDSCFVDGVRVGLVGGIIP
jgi:hypothetical protein